MIARTVALAVITATFAGCASAPATIELPLNHPANPNAAAADIQNLHSATLLASNGTTDSAMSEAAGDASAEDMPEPKSGAGEDPHKHHHNHANASAESLEAAAAPEGHSSHTPTTTPAAAMSATYVCPMHKTVVGDGPGKCPKCGMKLVPKKGAKEVTKKVEPKDIKASEHGGHE